MEHGVTFAEADAGAFELNAPVAGQIKNARVVGSQMLLRSVMSYEAASKAMGGEPKAFEDATKFLVGNMVDSVAKKLEIALLYGTEGYGKVELPVTAGTNVVVKIQDAEFASGIWSGAENMPLEIVRLVAGVPALQTAITSMIVKSVNLEDKTITVDLAGGNLLADDVIYHKGAFGKEFKGIHSILSTSGNLFGIDSSQYTLWKGTEFDASVAGAPQVLSFAILQQAIAKGVAKGLDTAVMVLVNPGHWDDLLTEQAALRQYDASYKSAEKEAGSQKIKFHSQNGEVEIVPSIHVKEGYAYVLTKEDWVRIGSTDITFKRPGKEGEFFLDLPTHAGYELRCYTEQCIFCVRPGRSILIKGLKTE